MDVAADRRPILIIPYMWIGDFVRGHTAVRVLRERWPDRPVDLLTTTLCAPLLDYMPGVRKGILWNLPRGRVAPREQLALARRLQLENYGTAIVMPRTWKSALAPALAGIPERTGFLGEARLGLLNDWRLGERALPRMIDRMVALTQPRGVLSSAALPPPQLNVPAAEIAAWRTKNDLRSTAVALAPGAVGPSKRWPYYAELAQRLASMGIHVWVVGGPGEKESAREIVKSDPARLHDLTGADLRNGIMAIAAANLVVSNDSGLSHVAAALGQATIGIFGPTSAYHWAPLNGLTAAVQLQPPLQCQPCHKPRCRLVHHKCMADLEPELVLKIVERNLEVNRHDSPGTAGCNAV